MTDLMDKVWSAYWNGGGHTDAALARVVEVVKQDCRSQANAEIVAAAYRSFAAQIERGAEIDLEAAFTAGFRAGKAALSLDKPAMVGNAVFREGVAAETVIGAAQRCYEQKFPSRKRTDTTQEESISPEQIMTKIDRLKSDLADDGFEKFFDDVLRPMFGSCVAVIPKAAFGVGDQVEKHTGDYHAKGEVRGIFAMKNGAIRYVVEHPAEGGGSFCHIYSEKNLRKVEP